jgi:hypothetical protein
MPITSLPPSLVLEPCDEPSVASRLEKVRVAIKNRRFVYSQLVLCQIIS